MKIPQGFHPVSFKELLKSFDAATLTMLWKHVGLDEDEARRRIKTLEDRSVVQFAISPQFEPSVFARSEQVGTEDDQILVELLVSFWDVTGQFDDRDGKIYSAGLNDASVIRVDTPEGPLAIIGSVAKKLVAMGLLTVVDGQYRGPSKVQVIQWTQEHGVCDFCSDSQPHHVEMVPDFELVPNSAVALSAEILQASAPEMSIGGWASCDTCHTMIIENRRADLLQRAIVASRGGKFTAAALKGLHKRFWKAIDTKVEAAAIGAALNDFIEDRISPEVKFENPKLAQKSARQEAIRRLTGLTQDEVEALVKGDVLYKDVAKKLSAWRRRFGVDTVGEKKVAEMLNAFERPTVLHPWQQPHWQQALDRKVEAIQTLTKGFGTPPVSVDAAKHFFDMQEDLQALKVSEVYSFNADTMHAIRVASESIPHEAPLKSVEVPVARSGWFWFAEPFPAASAPISSDYTHALLWTWDTGKTSPTIRFSAYVVDDKGTYDHRGRILPSAKWYWPLEASFHEMIGLNTQWYREAYGEAVQPEKGIFIGEEAQMKVITAMSLFFMQACSWFRQTVPGSKKKIEPKLTQEPGHIERHARKRYEKEFKVPPSVRVIALRKSDKTLTERVETTDAEGKRHLKVRFVVSGHNRLQPCGPGRKDVKLIWIDSYPKGPEDAPFQPPRDKVFAVIR